MSSFILHFRPWLLAFVSLVAIEATYFAVAKPPRSTWNNFLDFQFTLPESVQKLETYEKVMAFENADPDIIQVGDSSGLHGVQPPIVESYIPGFEYLNLGVATTLGYSGYYDIAKLQLQRSPHARYLVLYTQLIGGVPRKILWDESEKLIGPEIEREFLSPLHRFFQLPTLAARRMVTEYAYYFDFRFKQRGEPLSRNRGYMAFTSIFRTNNGWTRETDVEKDVPANIYNAILPTLDVNSSVDTAAVRNALKALPRTTDESFFDWRTLSRVSYFDYIYGAFADLAKKHNVKLIVVFNPLPESAGRPEFEELMDWKAIKAGLSRVRENHPEIMIVGNEFWPDEKFSVFSHVASIHSDESSRRMGEIMKRLIGDERPVSRVKPAPIAPAQSRAEVDFSQPYCGYGWTDKNGFTNGFPLQYVGTRKKTWVWLMLKPGSEYSVRSFIHSDSLGIESRVRLLVNDIPAPISDVSKGADGIFINYLAPAEAINKYNGWVKLEFDFSDVKAEGANGKRAIEFRRLILQAMP